VTRVAAEETAAVVMEEAGAAGVEGIKARSFVSCTRHGSHESAAQSGSAERFAPCLAQRPVTTLLSCNFGIVFLTIGGASDAGLLC
jgi:hypothetical protein